ncbi:hypothetical protein J1614_003366 [Plenodomus biglobosus]|nr:hypothetical protein J1614_003366 [Plenodomus biglobosus]
MCLPHSPLQVLPCRRPSRINEPKTVCTHRASRIEGSSHPQRKHAHPETPPGLAHPSAATCWYYAGPGPDLQASGSAVHYESLHDFILRYPDKAFDHLVRYYENDSTVQGEINADLYHPHRGPWGYEHSSHQTGTFPTSSIDSPYHDCPPLRQKPSHRPSFGAAQPPYGSPLSPPGSASQASRTSSKGESTPRLYITLVTDTGTGVEEETVRVRHAPIPHSVIRMAVVERQNLTDRLTETDTRQIPISRSAAPGIFAQVSISFSIELTWFRPGSDMTHKTTFMVVASDLLDIDVLLGEKETGEPSTGLMPNAALQTSRNYGHVSRGSSGNVPSYAQAPPAASWHRSDTCVTGDDSSTTTVQHQSAQHHQQLPQFLQPIFNQSKPPQQSSPTAVHPSRPAVQIDTSSPARSPAVLAASTHQTSDPNVAIGRIRLSLDWGLTPIQMWLDLCASGDAFFQTFQKHALQRKRTFERAETTIYLRQTKKGHDEEEYPVSLGEEELDADWELTVSWVVENKRDKPPHIHGRVEVGEG